MNLCVKCVSIATAGYQPPHEERSSSGRHQEVYWATSEPTAQQPCETTSDTGGENVHLHALWISLGTGLGLGYIRPVQALLFPETFLLWCHAVVSTLIELLEHMFVWYSMLNDFTLWTRPSIIRLVNKLGCNVPYRMCSTYGYPLNILGNHDAISMRQLEVYLQFWVYSTLLLSPILFPRSRSGAWA